MKTVAELLRTKPSTYVHHISPEASVLDAVKLLAEKKIGALLVMAGDAWWGSSASVTMCASWPSWNAPPSTRGLPTS